MPVDSKGKYDQLIQDTRICNETPWAKKLLRAVEQNYGKAPYFNQYYPWLKDRLLGAADSLCELDIQTTRDICGFLGLQTELRRSSELKLGKIDRTERLVHLCRAVGASSYLSGPSAREYIGEAQAFTSAGIELRYAQYDFLPYPQGGGDFIGEVSVIDLLFHCGPAAASHAQFGAIEKGDCESPAAMLNAPHEDLIRT